ncbi:hypothetical protein ACFWBH_36805 [Streptomyces sp. NPDC059999]|uniref:hypothetical protein n=1 Tax=Streptomyces sp. NPDC059999 TaxID=3347030 RepID=UPI0036965CA5
MPTADELLSADTVSNLAGQLARAARTRRSRALTARAGPLDGLGFGARVAAVRDAVTTRRHHPGEHLVQLQVNGRVRGEAAFSLDVP